MAKPVTRISALQFALGAGMLLVVARAGWLQLVRGRELAQRAERQRTAQRELEAQRGTIYDRNRTPLVVSIPKFRVQLALNEVKDTARLISIAALVSALARDSSALVMVFTASARTCSTCSCATIASARSVAR